MRRTLFVSLMAVLLCLPTVVAQAGVGNGTSDVPPGLLMAQQKTWDAFTRQIDKENARYDVKLARLQAELDEALALGDFELADKIQDKIDKLTLKHDEKIARLEAKRQEKWQKFDDKMAAFLLKHAEEESEPPPPEEPAAD
jgi:Skp family chaperone for outer membrane proteins